MQPRLIAYEMFVVVVSCAALSPGLHAEDKESVPTPAASEATAEDSDEAYGRLAGKAGESRDDNGLKMKFVWCPPGAFVMGDFDDDDVTTDSEGKRKPDVTAPVRALLTHGFWLGCYEVKQAQWNRMMDSQPWHGKPKVLDAEDAPASFISFYDAAAFCRQLTRQERAAGRLPAEWAYRVPTEAQWERACRAGTETRYCFGGDDAKLDDYAWSFANSFLTGEFYAHRVGQKMPNAWGLYDMHGNVAEWCRDVYWPTLPGGKDPEVRSGSQFRVLHGGCYHELLPRCRSGMRQRGEPDFRGPHLGFRVALVFQPEAD